MPRLSRRALDRKQVPAPPVPSALARADVAATRQLSSPAAEREAPAPPSVQEGLRSPGQPLDPATRGLMESRFGRDFAGVRVHTHAPSARDLGAAAYTAGRDIVFDAGVYRPETPAGRQLLAHELAHVAQRPPGMDVGPLQVAEPAHPAEGAARSAALAGQRVALAPQPAGLVLRAPSGLPALPPTKTYKEMWTEFEKLRFAGKDAEALAMAPGLVSSLGYDEAIQYGGDLALWLIGKGRWDLARQALKSIEGAWWIRFVTINGKLPTTGGWGSSSFTLGPEKLIEQAELQAAANQHDRARVLFGMAFLFLQMQLTTFTDERLKKLAEVSQQEEHLKTSGSFGFLGLLRYQEPASIYASMRRVLSFYPAQQRQALVAGDAARAKQLLDLDQELRRHIKASHSLLTGTGEGLRGITLEGTFGKDKKRGEGYTLHGANQVEEFVTPLPGTPRPDELGRHPAYTAPMEELFETLTGQEDFLTAIFAHPEVRKEFKDRPPTVEQMSDMDVRLRVWRPLLQAFQKQPAAGCPTALCSLLRMVERYQRSFTAHTEYNVDDFGKSYLGRKMPTDLAGRALRDCGVYAITTAYEVYRTVKGASPKIDASFQLFQTLEHVMLVILDKGTSTHYVVNNDKILGPKPGDPSATIASAYAEIIGHPHVLSAAATTPALDSSLGDLAFRQQLWTNFQSAAQLGLDVPPGLTAEDVAKAYYQVLDRFDKQGAALHARLDQLVVQLAGADPGKAMAAALPALTRDGLGMATTLDAFASNRIQVGLKKAAPVKVERRVLTSAGRDGEHPLVRVCMALLHAEQMGRTLDADQKKLLDLVRNIPGATFAARLTAYVAAGRPARF